MKFTTIEKGKLRTAEGEGVSHKAEVCTRKTFNLYWVTNASYSDDGTIDSMA